MFNLASLMADLSTIRPLFHSEADFQHAFAWRIHELHPEARVRLEYRLFPNEPLYLDIWVEDKNCQLAIELKYAKRSIESVVNGEVYVLTNQGAQDLTRYDYIKDIARLERVVKSRPAASGYAILLTNDSSYWRHAARGGSIDEAFRLHQDAVLDGNLAWAEHAGTGTTKNREQPHELVGMYTLNWRDYSQIEGHHAYGQFRYLSVCVTS